MTFTNTTVVTESGLDTLLEIAKQRFGEKYPEIRNIEEVRFLVPESGLRVKYKAPVLGPVEATIRLVIEPG